MISANSENGVLQWRCDPYGLRVNITVQLSNCSQDLTSSGQLCSGRGRCSVRRYEVSQFREIFKQSKYLYIMPKKPSRETVYSQRLLRHSVQGRPSPLRP